VRRLAVAVLITSAAACDSATQPGRSAAGEWNGLVVNEIDVLRLYDMELTVSGDSVEGQASVSGSLGFADGYFISGNQRGDSVTFRMMPAEDQTWYFEGVMADANRIEGRAAPFQQWDQARTMIFTRAPEQPASSEVGRRPLTELGADTYKGFAGGLYTGSNSPPAAHTTEGIARRNALAPLGADGAPSPTGKIVLLSVGMSNTTQEFCSGSSTTTQCASFSFMGQAAADPEVNHSTLAIVNGARGSQVAASWDEPADAQYDSVRITRLGALGLTEQQVQIAWVKLANPGPTDALPAPSDAHTLAISLGAVIRTMKIRYPNLRMVFLSSRIYAGWATTNLNPEPYAYESGFAVKWVVASQVSQMAGGGPFFVGSLNYQTGEAPWIAWGPYLWADGLTPRLADGLVWTQADLQADGTHPSNSGMQKVGTQLLTFFKTSPFTSCWFLAGQTCQ
jgi:hypothetical protein